MRDLERNGAGAQDRDVPRAAAAPETATPGSVFEGSESLTDESIKFRASDDWHLKAGSASAASRSLATPTSWRLGTVCVLKEAANGYADERT
jgi:hypothetical protein